MKILKTLKPIGVAFLFACAGMLASGCGDGDNLFKSAGSSSDKSSATVKDEALAAINAEDWEAAQAHLEQLLIADPSDYQARSMLGNVLLKKSGIDILVLSNSVSEASDAGGTVNVAKMIASLPEASTEVLGNLQKSVEAFTNIPDGERTASQKLQLAMAQFSLAMVVTKSVATDSAGGYDAGKASTMNSEEASRIVSLMDDSAETVTSIGGSSNIKGAAKISKTTDGIKAQEGDNDADRLRAYLAEQAAKQGS